MIGFTVAEEFNTPPCSLEAVPGRREWKDVIHECLYRVAAARAMGLTECTIRYPYVINIDDNAKFVHQDAKQKVLEKIFGDLRKLN